MYHIYMLMSDRDRSILHYLADFGLLTERQIRGLCFADLASTTPCTRTIQRLLKSRLISRLDFRLSGKRGGGGEFIYRLAPSGLKLQRPSDRYRHQVTNWAHTLEISETFLHLKQLEHAGVMTIDRYATEPEAWRTIGAVEVRPDLYIELTQETRRRAWWLEVDLATEKAAQLRNKLEATVRLVEAARAEKVTFMPRTVWIAPDVRRAGLLSRLVEETGAPELFTVTTTGGLGRLLQD